MMLEKEPGKILPSAIRFLLGQLKSFCPDGSKLVTLVVGIVTAGVSPILPKSFGFGLRSCFASDRTSLWKSFVKNFISSVLCPPFTTFSKT
jgi:hypothetical protein